MTEQPVRLTSDVVAEIQQHARETYPDECCGFLVASEGGDDAPEREIDRVERAANNAHRSRERRFVIGAEELRGAEERARASGATVVGFYHSHPDHPARPSQFDQEHAWPWYTYLVIAVTSAGPGPLGAFELSADEATFHPVPLKMPATARVADE